MPVPIICLDENRCHFVERYRHVFSKPQYQYFVIVLLGLMLCEGRRTLLGLLRQVQPKRRGRPRIPLVTGYLIGDDEGVAQAQGQEDGWAGQASLDHL